MRGLFGGAKPASIAVVEPPVSQSYTRRARITFLVAVPVLFVAALAVSSPSMSLPWALLVSAAFGLLLGGAGAVLVAVWPVLRVLWWWSLEIATGGVLLGAFSALAHVSHLLVACGVFGAAAVGVVLVRPARRWLSRWAWCVIDRHRLRVFFTALVKATGTQNAGLLPLVLWACPTPAGERVWVWLRPGLDIAALEAKAGRLAVTCWAREARFVKASRRYAALIRVDITQRDPLRFTVPSPLTGLIPATFERPESPVLGPVVGLDLDDIPEPVDEGSSRRR